MSLRKQHTSRSVSFSFEGDIAGQIAAFVERVREEAVRPAAHAMAVVLYDEMRARVPFHMGKLQGAIYRWFDEAESDADRKTYQVGVNKSKAPHWWLVEHGHWRRHAVLRLPDGSYVTLKDKPLKTPIFEPAQPYLRVSVDAKISAAVEAGRMRMAEKIGEIMNA
ncbi:HK97 gp10 family phage protein [Achromobacter spanius]|uniref:HK97 gp10 family phage protein n=1 Tax=Achromobacter spanius TaxID=217203 RepID=UPI000F8FA13B|nr:HK97 gp10 family phage protein [Achromobacter spanius]AZS80671.1 HK97 gp10 family phage protein [Achromobacter spanius]